MISNLAMVLPFVILPELSFNSVSFSVPVGIPAGILVEVAMAPMRSCCLLCYLLSPALLGTWKKENSLLPPKSALKRGKVLLQNTPTISLDSSWWKKIMQEQLCEAYLMFPDEHVPPVTRKWLNSTSSMRKAELLISGLSVYSCTR